MPDALDDEARTRDDASATSSRWLPVLLVAVAAIVIVPIAVVAFVLVANSGPDEYRYIVEAGTGDRLDAGEAVETMPAELDVRVGDSLVIVNDDDRLHLIGPFSVRAGETLYHRFSEPGEIRDACTLQPDGEIVIRIA